MITSYSHNSSHSNRPRIRLGPSNSNANNNKQQKVCFHWRAGKCSRYPCPYLHRELPLPTPQQQQQSHMGNGTATSSKRPHGFADDHSNMPTRNSNLNNKRGRGPGGGRGGGVVRKAEIVCNFWVQGNCKYGEKCRYLHGWCTGAFSLLTQLEGHQKAHCVQIISNILPEKPKQGATESSSSSQKHSRDLRNRSWTFIEEKALVDSFYQIIAKGFKQDNGQFRNGYVVELEKNMLKILPNTDLREMPHIESKIKTWKKLWGCIYGALSTSGIAWSESQKMLNIEDEDVWTSYCKKDPDIIKLRNTSFTWYEDWQQIFGKDRATGEHAEAPGDVVEELDKQIFGKDRATGEHVEAPGDVVEELDKEKAEDASTGDSNATDRRNKKLKRQDVLLENVEKMHDSFNGFINTIAQHLGLMTQRIGYDQDLAKSRRDVYGIIDNIDIFTDEEKIIAATKIVNNPADVDLFLSLPIEMKKQYVTMKLVGQI